MGNRSGARECLFCRGRVDSREHIIPEWLSKAMDRRLESIRPIRFHEATGISQHGGATRFSNFRTRVVCQRCNSGWMSTLETRVKSIIGPLVGPCWPEDFDLGTLHEHVPALRQWMAKTALVAEFAWPKGTQGIRTDDLVSFAKAECDLPNVHLYVTRILQPDFQVEIRKGNATWVDGKLGRHMIHPSSVVFALQLNQLGLIFFRCPEANPTIVFHLVGSDGRYCACLMDGLYPRVPAGIKVSKLALHFPTLSHALMSIEFLHR